MKSALSPAGAILMAALAVSPAFVAALHARQAAGSDPCDRRLMPIKGDPLAYSRRGDRCEGLYVLQVSGSADLSLVALTEEAGSDANSSDQLQVRWGATPDDLPIHVRAVSLRRPIYYRMDAMRLGSSGRFEWPMADVVGRLNLRRDELGMLAWVEHTFADRKSPVYVPLRVGAAAAVPGSGQYVASVVPGVELSQIFITIAAIDGEGREQTYVRRDEPLNYPFYPAERPVRIKLTGLPAPGVYRVRLAALIRRGGSSTSTFLVFHGGPAT